MLQAELTIKNKFANNLFKNNQKNILNKYKTQNKGLRKNICQIKMILLI